jgi:hypothetical protein
MEDESIPGAFWRNETTMQDFTKAMGNSRAAMLALRDYAVDDFMQATVTRKNGKLIVDHDAVDEWIKQHKPQLQAFPDLVPMFKNLDTMQAHVDGLVEQLAAMRKKPELAKRLVDATRAPGERTVTGAVKAAEDRLRHVEDVVERTRADWQRSFANLFLKETPERAAARIVTERNPAAAYDEVAKAVAGHPEALMGLKRATWDALRQQMQKTTMTAEVSIGTWHNTIERLLTTDRDLMQRIIGEESVKRLERTNDAFARIARGASVRSDTAINLQVQEALASVWLTRAVGIASGRIGTTVGVGERVLQHLIGTFKRMTMAQQQAILEDSFLDPKVFQTLVLAGTHGPEHALVKHRLRLHLYNQLSTGEPEEPAQPRAEGQ